MHVRCLRGIVCTSRKFLFFIVFSLKAILALEFEMSVLNDINSDIEACKYTFDFLSL